MVFAATSRLNPPPALCGSVVSATGFDLAVSFVSRVPSTITSSRAAVDGVADTTAGRFGNFGVYVLEIAGERLVKRAQPKLDGTLTLISDNPAYEPKHIPPTQADDVRVPGRVLWTCGPPRA